MNIHTQTKNLAPALLKPIPIVPVEQDPAEDSNHPLKDFDIPAIHVYSENDSQKKSHQTIEAVNFPENVTEADFEAIQRLDPTIAKETYLAILSNPNADASLRLKAYLQIEDPSIDLGKLSPHLQALGEIVLGNTKASSIIHSSDLTQVYEPYWRYGEKKLRDYAEKLLKRISPCIIQDSNLDKNAYTVSHKGENIPIRKVKEFGRVLPLLHLRETLKQTNATRIAVPRIFLVRKDQNPITFTFGLPYRDATSRAFHRSIGDNPICMDSQSFDIYQEYIEGKEQRGSTAFFYYGHYDVGNNIQIIRSQEHSIDYLIDTKDSKNFFIPIVNAYNFPKLVHTYWLYKIGRYLPQDQESFQKWQQKQRNLALLEKCFNYDIHQKTVNIQLEARPDIMEKDTPVQAPSGTFDDDSESSRYFTNPEDNARRYLALKKFTHLHSLLREYPELDLKSVLQSIETYNPYINCWIGTNLECFCEDLKREHTQLSELIREKWLQ